MDQHSLPIHIKELLVGAVVMNCCMYCLQILFLGEAGGLFASFGVILFCWHQFIQTISLGTSCQPHVGPTNNIDEHNGSYTSPGCGVEGLRGAHQVRNMQMRLALPATTCM